jgi:transposase-like protein
MSAERLVEISESAVHSADPIRTLRGAAELRREIAALEVDAVERALAQGSSWSEIAGALGITKQAAHKRYARRTGRALAALAHSERHDDRSPQPRIHVTPPVRQAVRGAQMATLALDHEFVQGAHLLLGLLTVEGAAGHALLEIGAGFDQVVDVVRSLNLTRVALDRRRVSSAMRGRLPLAAHAETAIRQSLREAGRLGHVHLGGEHLLLGLLRSHEPTTVATLSHMTISSADLERCLGKVLMGWDLSPMEKRLQTGA